MPLQPRAAVAGRSGGQSMRGSSHPRVATAAGGTRAGGTSAGRGRRVVVARLVLLLFMKAEADVALQGGRS